MKEIVLGSTGKKYACYRGRLYALGREKLCRDAKIYTQMSGTGSFFISTMRISTATDRVKQFSEKPWHRIHP